MTDYERYILSRWVYGISSDRLMSDAEYSLLHQQMKAEYPEDEYVNRSWSSDPCPTELLKKHNMEKYIYIVTLSDKTESIDSIESLTDLKAMYGDLNEEAVLSFKHDGWNTQKDFYNRVTVDFNTRGRTTDAINIFQLKNQTPNVIDIGEKCKVCMEATVGDTAYAFCQKEFGNVSQRGAVSTLLAQPDYAHLLDFHAFDIVTEKDNFDIFKTLENWGFKTPYHCKVRNYEELISKLKDMSDMADTGVYESPTDGVVIRTSIGSHAIRVMHWLPPIYNSYVMLDKPYEEKKQAHRISVNLNVYPIKLKNSTQTSIPITNYERVKQFDLRPGSPVAFKLTSASISVYDESATRSLQKIWAGKYDAYRHKIEQEEMIKRHS